MKVTDLREYLVYMKSKENLKKVKNPSENGTSV